MNNLRVIRKKKDLTQKQVAKKLGIHWTTYTKYETGDSDPSSEMLSRLADFFDVSIDYLLGRDEKKPAGGETSGLSEEEIRIITLYKMAPPEFQAAALRVLTTAESLRVAPDGAEGGK